MSNENEEQKRIRHADELYMRGIKGTNFKERSIEQCLNCSKPECNGCPISEVENMEEVGEDERLDK